MKLVLSLLSLLTIPALAATLTFSDPSCTSFTLSGNALTCVQSAPGTLPPPAPPPPPIVGISCAGFANTVVLDIDWANPRRTFTGDIGPSDAVVVRFKTGAAPTNPYSSITGAEYGAPANPRLAVLSTTPCDFGQPPALGWSATSSGTGVSLRFTVGPNPVGFYPALLPNTVYYANVKTSGCVSTCNMYFDLKR